MIKKNKVYPPQLLAGVVSAADTAHEPIPLPRNPQGFENLFWGEEGMGVGEGGSLCKTRGFSTLL